MLPSQWWLNTMNAECAAKRTSPLRLLIAASIWSTYVCVAKKQAKKNKTKTKQNKTKQNKTKQNKTKQNKTKQNKTKRGRGKDRYIKIQSKVGEFDYHRVVWRELGEEGRGGRGGQREGGEGEGGRYFSKLPVEATPREEEEDVFHAPRTYDPVFVRDAFCELAHCAVDARLLDDGAYAQIGRASCRERV